MCLIGHTSKSWDLLLNFVSAPYILNYLLDFHLNITPMFLSVSWCAEPMTRLCRLKVKVMGFTVEFGVPSISPKPFEQFSFNFTQMLISVMMIRSNDSARQIQSHNFRSWNLPLNFVSAPYLLNPLNDLH